MLVEADEPPQHAIGLNATRTWIPLQPPVAANKSAFSTPDTWNQPVASDLAAHSTASCSATACHGGPRSGVVNARAARGSEAPLWFEQDPHARAWRTLCDPQSVEILERLQILKGEKILNAVAFANCLACHNSDHQVDITTTSDPVREGVSCESCHGPSEKWRRRHYQSEWPGLSDHVKTVELGFVNNKNLLSRARMCASCHVGDSQHDMNHDMIAAGHPPLLYELATFHNKLPKHWRNESAGDSAHFEATLWLTGQAAALDAQLALIESRASNSHTWPELSNYDCAACHKRLQFSRPSSETLTDNSYAGSGKVNWSQWNRWGIESLLSWRLKTGRSTRLDYELLQSLNDVAKKLESVQSERQTTTKVVSKARQSLDAWIQDTSVREQFESFSAEQLKLIVLHSGTRQSSVEVPSDTPNNQTTPQDTWESLAQLYLASVASRTAWPKQSSAADDKPVSLARQLRQHLLFSHEKTTVLFELDPQSTREAHRFLKSLQSLSNQPPARKG